MASLGTFLLLSAPTQPQDGVIYMQMGTNALPIHMPVGLEGKRLATTIADDDYWAFVMDICTGIGVACDFYVRHAEINNAMALIFREAGVDTRVIVYDRALSRSVGLEGAIAVLGHEIGHHICGHTKAFTGDHWKQELQADRIAGAALRKQGRPESSVTSVLPILSDVSTATHPPKHLRLPALKDGWSNPSDAILCK